MLRLKKASHREIARAQDMIVETLYEIFDNAVLHGGTSIWRCYKGNRFSEDVDVYLNRDFKKINQFFELLEKKGFNIEKKRIREASIFSSLKFNRTLVRFEALFKGVKGSLKEYETAEGNFLTVYSLTPEELVKEKVDAYLKRLKIRDLYDIFFLLRYVDSLDFVRVPLEKLLKNFKEPLDKKDLKVIILEGIVPTTEQMLSYMKRRFEWAKKNT